MRRLSILLYFLSFPLACAKKIPIGDMENPPAITRSDSSFAGVFQKLDGIWEGVFYIYRDTVGGLVDDQILQLARPSAIEARGMVRTDSLFVRQEYSSESPFFQRVRIQDVYPQSGETITSQGVNKIQDGTLWCVVRKPDETVIHQGLQEDPQTIIWWRNNQSPLKKEYFRETVAADTYTIAGWGYYGDDDTTQMPVFWFSSTYYRQ